MKVTVYTHPEFERKFKQYKKKYHSLVSDYRAFLDSIKENPFQGEVWVLGTPAHLGHLVE